jgi:hypothetical protein
VSRALRDIRTAVLWIFLFGFFSRIISFELIKWQNNVFRGCRRVLGGWKDAEKRVEAWFEDCQADALEG